MDAPSSTTTRQTAYRGQLSQEPSLRRCEQRMLNPLLAVLPAANSASTRSGRRDPDRPGARYRTNPLFDGGASIPCDGFWRRARWALDRKSTRLNSSHVEISYAVFCLKKK